MSTLYRFHGNALASTRVFFMINDGFPCLGIQRKRKINGVGVLILENGNGMVNGW
jgi:hypothetical protein